MKDKLVSYETAKKLAAAGFKEYTDWCYDPTLGYAVEGHLSGHISAPTQSLAQKWIREKKGIMILIRYGYEFEWYIDNTDHGDGLCDSYETALEEGLKYALSLNNMPSTNSIP